MSPVALMVDSHGSLNAVSLETTSAIGWQGPVAVGSAALVPGSPVAVFQQSATVFTALMVDQDGMLNSASLDTSSAAGWRRPGRRRLGGPGTRIPGRRVPAKRHRLHRPDG